MLPSDFTCGTCLVGRFRLVEKVRGFATIPAQRERIVCERCGATLDLYLWWPSIRERRSCAILIEAGKVPA